MYEYQESNRYFAQVADDIKDITEAELKSFGAEKIEKAYKGVFFTGSQEVLYKINLQSCLINRVLAPLISFNCSSEDQLYKSAYQINWENLFSIDNTIAIYASVSQSNITHSKFAALKLKDAIVDRLRNLTGERPSVDTRDPDIWLNLHIDNNIAVISLDTSGGSLHRRSYRKESVAAPMVETLAASIIKISGWDGSRPLYDPLCGSGTLLCEAYLHITKTPPAILRTKFGFEKLPDFNETLWRKVRHDVLNNITPIEKGFIAGSDASQDAVKSALKNCSVIDEKNTIEIKQINMFDIHEIKNKTIVCNPPYGIRLKKNEDLSGFYKQLGDFLKQKCSGSTAYIYFGDRMYLKTIGLRPSMKMPLANGGLDGRLARFELY
ncbi:MAG: class I SAM-dependent RNA methyltransferase [Bacteroidetes bacterium]|nr:class I SAM-dependent RNA methyltransferase [Bacteroidota bacterium]